MEVEGAGGVERYAKNDKRQADVLEKDATRSMNGEADDAIDLNKNKSIDTEEEVKVVGKSLRSLSSRERMKRLSPHRHPLKDRMNDKTIFYVN